MTGKKSLNYHGFKIETQKSRVENKSEEIVGTFVKESSYNMIKFCMAECELLHYSLRLCL